MENNWMKRQIITLLSVATGREIEYVWSFVIHLIRIEGAGKGEWPQ